MRTAIVLLCLSTAGVGTASAQTEDVEPRIIGQTGTMTVGFSGFVDRFFSSEALLPANYTAQVDWGRFITKRFVVRVGVAGTGSFGAESDDETETGSGVASVHGLGGVLFYFTPQSIFSFYAGTEYWRQLTRRADADSGSVIGKAGLQAAVSSRASFFIEGGYGARLTRGDEGEVLTRMVGQLGLRIKF